MSNFKEISVNGTTYFACPVCTALVISPGMHIAASAKCSTEMLSVRHESTWKAVVGALHEFDFDE